MTTKTFVCCDRCGATVEPVARSTISHTKLQVTTFDREYINAPKDLCERCTQSLKMWLGNLPNRQVMYRQIYPEPLEDGTFTDVVRRIEEGAFLGDFRRESWPEGEYLKNPIGFPDLQRSPGYGENEPLTAEDYKAQDWMEDRLDEADGEDEEGDE